jgi:hypothetical protein
MGVINVLIHRDKYDYSLISNIKNCRTKVKIICPEHGEFMQTTNAHLNQNKDAHTVRNQKAKEL